MEVILKQDVKNLGEKDDVVKVKPGYVLAENLKQAQFKQEKIRKDADAIAARLEGIVLSIGAKAGETGKIFGAINTIQIADALKKEGFDVDRRRITFDAEPKFVGDYTANLNLHKEVKVKVPFTVVAE